MDRCRTGGRRAAPLAERMRPRTFDEFVGQEELLAPGKPLREAIERDLLQSIILWGPPGTGKTTLARIIADTTKARFVSFSAVLAGIKEIRDVMAEAERLRRATGRRTIVFIDEIHRFNKAQQDAFLPRVEAGDIVLIGATTENPSFEVNAALLSRSKVFVLRGLTTEEVARDSSSGRWHDRERGLGASRVDVDRRRARARSRATRTATRASALNLLELSVGAAPVVDGRAAGRRRRASQQTIQRRALLYDKVGRGALQHHFGAAQVDAQQRSGRGGLLAGADGRGRRGSAVHRAAAGALRVGGHRQRRSAGARPSRSRRRTPCISSACPKATPRSRRRRSIWPPRRRATRSTRRTTAAAEDAQNDVAEPVPLHLRNAPTRLMKELDYGKGYRYAHDEADAVADMSCLPPALEGRKYYQPRNADSRRRSSAGSTAGRRSRSSAERTSEQLLDRRAPVVLQRPRAGAGEMRVGDHRRVRRAARCHSAPVQVNHASFS